MGMGVHRAGVGEMAVRATPRWTGLRRPIAGVQHAREGQVMLKHLLNCGALTVLMAGCLVAETSPRVQTFPLRDTAGLIAPKAKLEALNYLGRKSVRITIEGEDHDGLALL